MTKHILWLLVTAVAVLSCRPETDTNEITSPDSVTFNNSSFLKETSVDPSYLPNPYDKAGSLHNQLLTVYLNTTPAPQLFPGMVAMVEGIALQEPEFTVLASPYQPITSTQAAVIATGNLGSVLSSGSLSPSSQTSLAGFITSFMEQEPQKEYPELYAFITNYESTIIRDNTISISDKKVILTTASIVRHSSLYHKNRKRGKDKDWKLSVGNIISAADGASESTAKAITMSIAHGLTYTLEQ